MGSSSKGSSSSTSSSGSLPAVGTDVSTQSGYNPAWAAGSGQPAGPTSAAAPQQSFDAAGFAQAIAESGGGFTPSNIPSVDITPSAAPGSGGVQNFRPLPFATSVDIRRGADIKGAAGKAPTNTDLVTQFLAALQGKGGAA